MTEKLSYHANLNGVSFRLFELEQLLKFQDKGYSESRIRNEVLENNAFQNDALSLVDRMLPVMIERMKAFDFELRSIFLQGTINTKIILNLYAIMKTDLLFYEFMNEVIRKKFDNDNLYLELKDVNVFFTEKSEQSEIVLNWSEATKEKLSERYRHVLVESGILKSHKDRILIPQIIDEEIRDYFITNGYKEYIYAMGDEGEL